MTKLKKRIGKFGSRLLFEWTLEMMRDSIVKGLRENLAPITPGDIPKMVRKGLFPPLEHIDFSLVTDNPEYRDSITEVRLMEIIAEARPDLATAIQDMGMPGARYVAKLRLHLLDLAKHPEKALGELTESKEKMKLATCSECGKSWPVPENEASSIKECPFCGGGKDEPKEPAFEGE